MKYDQLAKNEPYIVEKRLLLQSGITQNELILHLFAIKERLRLVLVVGENWLREWAEVSSMKFESTVALQNAIADELLILVEEFKAAVID